MQVQTDNRKQSIPIQNQQNQKEHTNKKSLLVPPSTNPGVINQQFKLVASRQGDQLPQVAKRHVQNNNKNGNTDQSLGGNNKNSSDLYVKEGNRVQSPNKPNMGTRGQQLNANANTNKNGNRNVVFKSTNINPNTNASTNKNKIRVQTEVNSTSVAGNGKYAQIYGFAHIGQKKQKGVDKDKQKAYKISLPKNSVNVSLSNNNITKQRTDNFNPIPQHLKHTNSLARAILSTTQTPNPTQPQNYNRNHPPFQLSKQQLYQQNLQLKSTINQLRETLNKQRIQTEMQRKKNKKYTTKLNREFKKEFYYNSFGYGYGNLSNSLHQYVSSPNIQTRPSAQYEQQIRNQYLNPSSNLVPQRGANKSYNIKNSNYDNEEEPGNQMKKFYTNTHLGLDLKKEKSGESRNESPEREGQDNSQNASKEKVRLYSQHLPSASGTQTQYQKYHKNYNHYKQLTKPTPHLHPDTHSTLPTQHHTPQYLIAGIKQKYQQLRHQHQNVLNELAVIKGTSAVKKLEEISVYCNVLEENNRRMAGRLRVLEGKLGAYEGRGQGRDQGMYNQAVIAQLNQKIQSLKQKNTTLKSQLKHQTSTQKQSQTLITYLQTLLIQKDNLTQKSLQSTKKMHKIIQKLSLQLQLQKQQNLTTKSTYLHQLESIHQKHRSELLREKKMFQEAIVERNLEIKRKEKEVEYLSTVLEYWRPHGEDRDRRESLEEEVNRIKRKRKESTISGNVSIMSRELKQESQKNLEPVAPINKFTQRRQFQKDYQNKINQLASATNRIAMAQNNQISKSNSKKNQKPPAINTERKRKTSAVKHSQDCKKMRKVAPQHIAELPQYLRYRLIGQNMHVDQACRYLDYRPLNWDGEGEDQLVRTSTNRSLQTEREMNQIEKWKKKYINLAELKAILIQEPFKLRLEDAVLVSRYIIQDQFFYENNDMNNGFVYLNFQNQIQRIVAKSILKAFIQTHSTNFLQSPPNSAQNNPDNKFQQCAEQWKQILAKSGNRLNTALVSIAPTGTITKQRWNQLLESISISLGGGGGTGGGAGTGGISDDLKEWCVGMMLVNSESLGKLCYRVIVPDRE